MKISLLILLSITGLTAAICGAMLLSMPNGTSLQLSTGLLSNTPFANFFIPGLILFALVGGSHLLAVFLLIQRKAKAFNFSLLAGIIICGWVLVQAFVFTIYHWLQFVYLLMGILIILLSFHLKGKELI